MTTRDTTQKKTPKTTRTRKKRQTPDPKQRKIGELLTFWQGSTRPSNRQDNPDTEEAETRTRHQGRTVTPDQDQAETLTVERRVTVKRGGPDIVADQDTQRDSPTKTRIQEIKLKFRTRITDTVTQGDQTQTRPPAVAESKRKADTESNSRPSKKRVTAERRVRESREGKAASSTGPISKYFKLNLDKFSAKNQGGQGQGEGESPGGQSCQVREGGVVQRGAQISACSTMNILKNSPIFLPEQHGGAAAAVSGKPDCLHTANQSQGLVRTVGKTGFSSARLDTI